MYVLKNTEYPRPLSNTLSKILSVYMNPEMLFQAERNPDHSWGLDQTNKPVFLKETEKKMPALFALLPRYINL